MGDGFLAKLSSSGSTLIYATYLGGSGDDAVSGLVVDQAGTVYATGYLFFGFPGDRGRRSALLRRLRFS
jgi:hypothetical protein